jgi:hypothetical protein
VLLLRERLPGERHKRVESANYQQLVVHKVYEMRGSLPTKYTENNTLDKKEPIGLLMIFHIFFDFSAPQYQLFRPEFF